jgi:peptide/nickel transport system substrate-binding protein
MTRIRSLAAIAVVAALALAGCSAGGGSEGGTTLTLGATVSPTTYDPAGSEWANRSPYYQAVYDTLLVMTPEGEVQPWLATEWTYNDDQTVLEITLRDDVTFTDGTKLTPEVVKENLERFRDGTGVDANFLAAVDTIDVGENSVTLNLSAPDPALLDYLARDAGLVASAQAIDGGELATTPVGSGPYIYDESASVSGSTYAYSKNPDYWNPDVQYYDRLVINVFADPTAALNAIKAGEANGVKLASNDNNAEVEAAGWTVNSSELDVANVMLFDRDGVLNPAMADVRVRQAINYAFDRDALLAALQQGNGTVTGQMFPPRSDAWVDALDTRYSYDPAKARELLAEAGYANGLTIQFPTVAGLGANTYALMAQQLQDIGITSEYVESGNNFISDLFAGKFPGAYLPFEQASDWQLIQMLIAPNAGFNPLHVQRPEVDAMIKDVQFGDDATRSAALKKLNTYLVENAWFAPLYRVMGGFGTDANTTAEMLPTNVYPSLYDIKPKS